MPVGNASDALENQEVNKTTRLIVDSGAVWQLLTDESKAGGGLSSNMSCEVPKLHCRLVNFDPVTPLKSLRANCYGQWQLYLSCVSW